jgi:AcrR family transcriptional regulator
MDKTTRRRSEIIEAAYNVFSEKGYHATRIEDITSELNIAHGLFYYYFNSKLDIFTKVIDEVIERISVGVMEEYVEQIERGGRKLLDLFTDDPRVSMLLFYEALGIDASINQKIQEAFDLFASYTEMYFRNGIEKGYLRSDFPVRETAQALNAMIFEAARRVALARNRSKAKKVWIEAVKGLLLRGLALDE